MTGRGGARQPKETAMKIIVFVKANQDSESGVMPTTEQLAEMGAFNEELVKAGVMLSGEGLLSSAKGKRVRFDGKKRAVVDGPFSETKELVAGFWIWKVKSMDEALDWARRIPFQDGEVELRQVAEEEDFGAEFTPELREQEAKLRTELERQQTRR
jgi:hypothetical protein